LNLNIGLWDSIFHLDNKEQTKDQQTKDEQTQEEQTQEEHFRTCDDITHSLVARRGTVFQKSSSNTFAFSVNKNLS